MRTLPVPNLASIEVRLVRDAGAEFNALSLPNSYVPYFSIDEHGRDITCPIWWSQSTCCFWMVRNATDLRTCLGFRSEICSIPIIRWQVDTFCFSWSVETRFHSKCWCYNNFAVDMHHLLCQPQKRSQHDSHVLERKWKHQKPFYLGASLCISGTPPTTTESWDFRAGQLDQFVGLAASWILKEVTLKTVGILQVSKDVLTRALRSNLQSWTLNLTIVMQGWLQLWNGTDESY